LNTEISRRVLAKDHYRHLYQTDLEEEAEWLGRGAIDKTNSIEMLLNRNNIRPKTILELGCGVGAVLFECQRRNIAKKYIGVEYAPEAISYLRKHSVGIESIQGDITDPDFCIKDACDVVVISHVIEHLKEPANFLTAIKKSIKFSHFVVEVPLEDLLVSKIKSLLRDPLANKAGHLQFFTRRSIENLLRSNGFNIIDRRTYVPILDMETIHFIAAKDRLARHHRLFKVFSNNLFPRMFIPLWKRLYYAHHAILCV